MRNLKQLDAHRVTNGHVVEFYGSVGDQRNGVFTMPSPVDKATLVIIAASGDGWDHVSVSRKNRCPNWQEMEYVKRRFFGDDETAMQLHVPAVEHINYHPHCLHLWRPLDREIPQPPAYMIA